jgi:hypothetical protein
MGIGIYTEANSETLLSQDDLFTKPFAITFDGRTGGYKEVKLFLRNDDVTRYYTDLIVSLEDLQDPPVTSRPEDGFVWKLSYGDIKPTFNDWVNTPAANSLTIPVSIGGLGDPDVSTYLPFWVFIQIPPNLDIQVITGVKFVIQGNEALI